MSNRMKNILAYLLLAVLASSAFIAGYFTNDFVELRQTGELPSIFASSNSTSEFDLFWEAWRRVEDNFIGEKPTQQELAYGAIRGAFATLNDPYTIFVEPVARQEERENLQGTFGGIGAFLTRPEEEGDVILSPIPGNPAEIAGILEGDVLVAVDGVPVTAVMTMREVADMIKGPKDTTVTLTVIHPGDEAAVEVTITRGDILIPSVSYRLLDEDNSIGYIRLTRFSGESSNEISGAVTDLREQGAESLILDLRGNGGGLLDAAVDIADLFLEGGPVVYQVNAGGEQALEANVETLAPDVPLVVLVDGGSASASEILAGALQDRERAVLIGSQKTFGKGSVQLVFDLSDGSSVHVTSARWFTPNRNQIDQQGLEPDILVEITQEAIDNGRDLELRQAVEYLQAGN